MTIKVGYDFLNNKIVKNEDISLNLTESALLEKIKKDLNLNDAKIVANTEDYTTLQLYDVDLIRIKYTDRSKWISIILSKEDRKNNINNPLFDAQKKKTQLFWKSNIVDDNLEIYYDFIKNRIIEVNNLK